MGSYNWNWPILLKEPYFGWIVSGFGKTILIAVFAWAIAFPLGSAIGIARTADELARLRLAGTSMSTSSATSRCWCRCSSGTSCVPELLPADLGRWLKRDLPYPQFSDRGGLPRPLHGLARRRAGALAASRRSRAARRNAGLATGLTPVAGLPLRPAPRRLPHHRSRR